jgi:hypothetical protein
MRTVKGKRRKYRVGDWVSLVYGPRMVLAQVTEDRGWGVPGGWRYVIRLDNRDAEPSIIQRKEEELLLLCEFFLAVSWRCG